MTIVKRSIATPDEKVVTGKIYIFLNFMFHFSILSYIQVHSMIQGKFP